MTFNPTGWLLAALASVAIACSPGTSEYDWAVHGEAMKGRIVVQ
jgi:hypothetical protein